MKRLDNRIVVVVLVISLVCNLYFMLKINQSNRMDEAQARNETAMMYNYVLSYSDTLEKILDSDKNEEVFQLLDEYRTNMIYAALREKQLRNDRMDDWLASQLELVFLVDDITRYALENRDENLDAATLTTVQSELKILYNEYTKVYLNQDKSENQKKEEQVEILNASLKRLYEIMPFE